MKINEKQFAQIAAGLNIDDRPNAEHKRTLRQQMLAASKGTTSNKTAPRIQPIWSRIMKSNITKSAAAAIIIIGVLTGIYQLTGSIDGASIAFADVIESMKNVKWLYQASKGFQGDVAGTGEQWIGFDAKIHAAKWADGKRTFWDINQQKRYEYDPEKNHITIEDISGTEMPFSIASPTAMLEGIHKVLVDQGAEVVIETTKYNRRKVQLQRFSLSLTEQSQLLKLYIDPQSKFLVAAEISAKDSAGKVLMDGVAEFSYPKTGPSSIYDLGVPKDTPILSDSASGQNIIDFTISQVDEPENWPNPKELVQKYLDARNRKDYKTTRLYWPESECWDEKTFEKETPIEYVVGKLEYVYEGPEKTKTYLQIPYDTDEYYKQHKQYRFKMLLSNQKSLKGRYYIVSGN